MKVLKLNKISDKINDVFEGDYELTDSCANPDAVLVRSFDMHGYDAGDKLLAVGRAGAGVNNIPSSEYMEKGVVVFNTPGANANAVKELVLASLLLCGRDIVDGIDWVKEQKGKGDDVKAIVEKGKNQFVGCEILGKHLGIIGLGAIGALVAESANDLGMSVIGYDPYLNKDIAKQLGGKVTIVSTLDEIFDASDFITLHVPYLPSTKYMVNSESIAKMRDGVRIINLARGELVNNADIIAALESGKVGKYVCDFPTDEIIGVKNVIATPHLGASTPEAEDNCAIMVANQLVDYLENGNIKNSVNFPTLAPMRHGEHRICILCANIFGVMPRVNEIIAKCNIHIGAINSAMKQSAYIMICTDSIISPTVIDEIAGIEGVYRVRLV